MNMNAMQPPLYHPFAYSKRGTAVISVKGICRASITTILSIVLSACSSGSSDEDPQTLNAAGNARLSWPAEFSILEGPLERNLANLEPQPLLVIVTEGNRIICQLETEILLDDIGSEAAFSQVAANLVPGANLISAHPETGRSEVDSRA